MTYEEYIASPRWRVLREAALARDGFRCRTCDTPDELEVHHRRYPEELGTETIDDLTTLCRACHEVITSELRGRRHGARVVVLTDAARLAPGRIEVADALLDHQLPDYRRVTPDHAQRPISGPAEPDRQGDAQDHIEAKED